MAASEETQYPVAQKVFIDLNSVVGDDDPHFSSSPLVNKILWQLLNNAKASDSKGYTRRQRAMQMLLSINTTNIHDMIALRNALGSISTEIGLTILPSLPMGSEEETPRAFFFFGMRKDIGTTLGILAEDFTDDYCAD
jgi:hypothetical protein